MNEAKGFLIAIGGKEDKGEGQPEHLESTHLKFKSEGVLEEIRKLIKSKNPVIEVITTASEIPDEYFQDYKTAFKKLGATAKHMNLRSREDAADQKVLQRIRECDGIMMTGGDQTRLTSILGGTQFINIVKERLKQEQFVIGGTSAGAACMSDVMMESGSAAKGNLKGELKVSVGLGFVNNVIIDTHFDSRGRFGRLAEAVASQPGILGIGLGEDTGIIVSGDGMIKAIGADSVYVLDGTNITYTNIAEVKEGKPVTIAKVEVYLISRYDQYDLNQRKFIPSPAEGKLE